MIWITVLTFLVLILLTKDTKITAVFTATISLLLFFGFWKVFGGDLLEDDFYYAMVSIIGVCVVLAAITEALKAMARYKSK